MTSFNLSDVEKKFFDTVTSLLHNEFSELKEKYGIWRVHSHFPLSEDELFHEVSDPVTQESTLRIIKKDELPQGAFPSTWKLTKKGPIVGTWCCDWGPDKVE